MLQNCNIAEKFMKYTIKLIGNNISMAKLYIQKNDKLKIN